MVTRRKFSREFKLEAVSLVKDRGVAVAQAARVSRDTQIYELTRHPVLRGPSKRKLPPAGALTHRSQSAPAKGSGMPGVMVSF